VFFLAFQANFIKSRAHSQTPGVRVCAACHSSVPLVSAMEPLRVTEKSVSSEKACIIVSEFLDRSGKQLQEDHPETLDQLQQLRKYLRSPPVITALPSPPSVPASKTSKNKKRSLDSAATAEASPIKRGKKRSQSAPDAEPPLQKGARKNVN